MERKYVYRRIDEERDYQEACRMGCKWNPTCEKSPEHFLVYIDQYLHRAKEATLVSQRQFPNTVLDNVRKIAALAVACLEKFGCSPRDMDDVQKRPDFVGFQVEGEENEDA